MRRKETKVLYTIIHDTFSEIACTFAGLALEHNLSNQTITDFAICLEDFYEKTLERIKPITGKPSQFDPASIHSVLHPHTVVEDLYKIFDLKSRR